MMMNAFHEDPITTDADALIYPLEQIFPGRNHDYAPGHWYACGCVTKHGLEYLSVPRPLKTDTDKFCAWLCESLADAQQVLTLTRQTRRFVIYTMLITATPLGLRFERGDRVAS